MNYNVKQYLLEWESWIKSEKRLSLNTINSYKRDLSFFLEFLKNYLNTEISIDHLTGLDDETLSAWFFQRLNNGKNVIFGAINGVNGIVNERFL